MGATMSLNTKSRLAGPAYLSNTVGNVYNPVANTFGVMTKIHIANTDSSSHTFTLYIGGTGGSTGGTEIAKGVTVAANSYVDIYCQTRMATTDFLSGLADAASHVTITVEGEVGAVVTS